MDYEMRAEYAEGSSPGEQDPQLEVWHITRVGEAMGLCGRDLLPSAVTQSSDAWGTPAGQPLCHSCGALYLHQVR
ncbi:hypothetical protein [Streptomyces sp. NPDC051569]|uniref:hypothetical protein n=1 Tax=Streptomyces sp. NPDC051569 TaxID=3365661 RepID=UPI0037895EDB